MAVIHGSETTLLHYFSRGPVSRVLKVKGLDERLFSFASFWGFHPPPPKKKGKPYDPTPQPWIRPVCSLSAVYLLLLLTKELSDDFYVLTMSLNINNCEWTAFKGN